MVSKSIRKEIKRAQRAIATGEDWIDCGCCGCWHPAGPLPLKAENLHTADCRNDEQRLPSHPEDYIGSLTLEEELFAEKSLTSTRA